ncbi:uncharacterized protein LY79DRAFT_548015 [Colletotrichum navitas]|uniref:Uncharacterized protein n=1 Tax=Colletotrichum navitas TaxID=681940 RepID=A0AAD8Q348_9PEZI|nr:uncharacterized protein LY79DRAFT_548015 [Colletotrichum navitas]KAK1595072.1 hypothetical protein LY79DRAFT_548015 [Colletotrichum navitas]
MAPCWRPDRQRIWALYAVVTIGNTGIGSPARCDHFLSRYAARSAIWADAVGSEPGGRVRGLRVSRTRRSRNTMMVMIVIMIMTTATMASLLSGSPPWCFAHLLLLILSLFLTLISLRAGFWADSVAPYDGPSDSPL